MTEDKTSAVDIETARREKALLGYEMAITLWIFQGQQRWARFNIMLFVNSIILGVIGLIITGSNSQALWLLPILVFVGLFLCGIWFFFMQRETEYARYYVRSARELEEKYLSDTVQTISRGKLFSDGNRVTIETSSESTNEFRLSWLARCLRAEYATIVVIIVLALLYIGTICLRLTGVCPFA